MLDAPSAHVVGGASRGKLASHDVDVVFVKAASCRGDPDDTEGVLDALVAALRSRGVYVGNSASEHRYAGRQPGGPTAAWATSTQRCTSHSTGSSRTA